MKTNTPKHADGSPIDFVLSDMKPSDAWPSDEDLLTRQFRYDDPESIDGLRRERPDPALDPVIVGFYKLRPPGGLKTNSPSSFVWCCHCQKPTHWDGRVLRDRGGGAYIIGVDCGRKHYGDKFLAIDRRFEDQLRRQKLLRRWTDLLDAKPILLEELERVLRDEIWRVVDARRRNFRIGLPDLAYRLTSFISRKAPLIIRSRIRDYSAEERRDRSYQRAVERYRALSTQEKAESRRNGLKPEPDDTPMFRDIEENVGQVEGGSIVTDAFDVRSSALRLKEAIKGLVPIDRLSTKTNNQLVRILRTTVEAAEALKTSFVETASAWKFYTPQNIDRIERWYDSVGPSPHLRLSGREAQPPRSLSELPKLLLMAYFVPPSLALLAAPTGARSSIDERCGGRAELEVVHGDP